MGVTRNIEDRLNELYRQIAEFAATEQHEAYEKVRAELEELERVGEGTLDELFNLSLPPRPEGWENTVYKAEALLEEEDDCDFLGQKAQERDALYPGLNSAVRDRDAKAYVNVITQIRVLELLLSGPFAYRTHMTYEIEDWAQIDLELERFFKERGF